MSIHGPHGHGEIPKPESPRDIFSRALSVLRDIVDMTARNTIDDMPNYRAILQTIKMTRDVSTKAPSRKSAEDLAGRKVLGTDKRVKAQARFWQGTGDAVTEKRGHEHQPTKKQRRH